MTRCGDLQCLEASLDLLDISVVKEEGGTNGNGEGWEKGKIKENTHGRDALPMAAQDCRFSFIFDQVVPIILCGEVLLYFTAQLVNCQW